MHLSSRTILASGLYPAQAGLHQLGDLRHTVGRRCYSQELFNDGCDRLGFPKEKPIIAREEKLKPRYCLSLFPSAHIKASFISVRRAGMAGSALAGEQELPAPSRVKGEGFLGHSGLTGEQLQVGPLHAYAREPRLAATSRANQPASSLPRSPSRRPHS